MLSTTQEASELLTGAIKGNVSVKVLSLKAVPLDLFWEVFSFSRKVRISVGSACSRIAFVEFSLKHTFPQRNIGMKRLALVLTLAVEILHINQFLYSQGYKSSAAPFKNRAYLEKPHLSWSIAKVARWRMTSDRGRPRGLEVRPCWENKKLVDLHVSA